MRENSFLDPLDHLHRSLRHHKFTAVSRSQTSLFTELHLSKLWWNKL